MELFIILRFYSQAEGSYSGKTEIVYSKHTMREVFRNTLLRNKHTQPTLIFKYLNTSLIISVGVYVQCRLAKNIFENIWYCEGLFVILQYE